MNMLQRVVSGWACATFLLATWAVTAPAQGEGESRVWQIRSRNGSEQIEGAIVGRKGAAFLIRDAAGTEHSVKLGDLADGEQRSALIDWAGAAVVSIQTQDVLDEEMGSGSGFVVDDGLVLTNYHVIRGAAKILLTFRVGDREAVEAQCVAVDRDNDIAVLKVAEVPSGVQQLEIGNKVPPRRGDDVWTISHPRGFEDTVAWGSVNAIRRTDQLPEPYRSALGADDAVNWVQTDAVLKNGSSGGPLMGNDGIVLGMNTWVAGENLGFAISSKHFTPVLKQATAGEPLELPLAPSEREGAMAWYSRPVAELNGAYTKAYEAKAEEVSRLPQEDQSAAMQALADEYQLKFFEMGQAEPTSWHGMQALIYTCRLVGESQVNQERVTKSLQLLAKHHLQSKDLGRLAIELAREEYDNGEKFCVFLVKKSKHQDVQASAAFALGMNSMMKLMTSDNVDLDKIQSRRKMVGQVISALKGKYADVKFTGGATFEDMADMLETQMKEVRVGLPAEDIVGVDLQGETFRLSDYKGQVVFLDFWVNWCPYCKRMFPHEREMVTKYAGQPFTLLGVHCENQAILEELTNQGVVTWRSWADGQQGPIATQWEIDGYPSCYLIDHNGIVRAHFASEDGATIDKFVDQLVAEAQAESAGATTTASTP
jgi:S1-C subfamily serine protease/thiol-disulfide isomerase/thioredoxin